MDTSLGERIFAILLTLVAVGSVITLGYFLVAVPSPVTTIDQPQP
jgi:uncharacterized membrane protein